MLQSNEFTDIKQVIPVCQTPGKLFFWKKDDLQQDISLQPELSEKQISAKMNSWCLLVTQ